MGPKLRAEDVDAVLELALEARASPDLATFVHEVTSPRLRALVPYDALSLNEIDPDRGTAVVLTDPPDYGFHGSKSRFATLIRQHPVAGPRSRGDLRTRRLSEMISVRDFHRLELYQEAYRQIGVEDQIVLGLPGEALVALVLSRSRRTFTDRDREVMEVVRLHLARAYQEVRERERLAQLVSGLETGLEERGMALVQIERGGRTAHAGDHAIELIGAYLGWQPGARSRLPAPILDWLAQTSAPLRLDGPRGRLVIRRLEDDGPSRWCVLLVEEQRTSAPSMTAIRDLGLSEREAQVARLLARGKRNAQIAYELGLREGTVRKHLEHIYRTLGVGSRGEAIAQVLARA